MPTYQELVNKYWGGKTSNVTAAVKRQNTSPAAVKSNDSGITTATDTKKATAYKPEDNPIIRALGAGDYGAGKNTRVDKVLKGAGQSTASSLVNALGTVSGGTGELTMGESINAARKGQNQQELETAKKQRQNAATKQKLYNKADELSTKSEKNIAEAKEGLGKVGQTLVDVGVAGTQMLGDAVLNLAAPGAGLIGMGLRSFGSGAQEQRQKGGTETDMLLGGLKSAAIEVFTERLGGFYGKSKLNGVIDDAIKSIGKSGAMPALLTLVKNGAEEAVEEILSDIFNPLADRVLDLDSKRGSGEKIGVFSEDNVKTMIHDGIVGGILGLVGGGGQIIENALGSDANTQTAQNAAEAPTAEERQTTPTTEANAVTEVQEKLNSALQNEQPQAAVNPVVAAIENVQSQQAEPETAEAKTIYTGESGISYTQKQLDALSDLSGDSLITAAEADYDLPYSRLGITNEQADTLRKSGLLQTETTEDGSTFEYIPSAYIGDERSRRFKSERKSSAEEPTTEKAPVEQSQQAPTAVAEQAAQPTAQPTMNDVVSAMTGRPIDAATVSNAETVQQANTKLSNARMELYAAEAMVYEIVDEETSNAYETAVVRAKAEVKGAETELAKAVSEEVASRVANMSGSQIVDEYSNLLEEQRFIENNIDSIARSQSTGELDSNTAITQRQALLSRLDVVKAELDALYPYLSNATVDDVIADMQANPADYGVTEEEITQYVDDGLGAANIGFPGEPSTPVERWIADAQNEGESAVHPVSNEQIHGLRDRLRGVTDIPIFDKNGRLTRGSIVSIINSGLTSNEIAALLTDMTFEGAFSYDKITDKSAISRAKRAIKKNGYGEALRQFLNDTADGKVSKKNTVLGIELYTNAVENGDIATAIDIAIALAADGTNSAQAMQARRLLSSMTPTGKLYAAVKVVERMSEQQTKRVGEKKIDRAAADIDKAARESARTSAKRFAGKSAEVAESADGAQMIGEPFWFEYQEKVGEAVSKALAARMENNVPRPAMFSKTLIKNLTDIAMDTMPATAKGRKMTPAEKIADYLNNKEFYDAAWQKAQEEIAREYGDNEQVINGLQDFLNTAPPVTQPVGTKIMLRALAESALDIDETNRAIVIQTALNVDGIDAEIANDLIAKIEQTANYPLDEETRGIIYAAANQYVSDIIGESVMKNAENGKTESDIVRTQVKAVLNSIGEKLSQIAASPTSQKTAVATAVAEELTARWGLSADDAADIADVVESEFSEMVKESMEARLDSMYGKADARVKRTLAEKLAENINLGAFESADYALDAAEKLLGARVEIDPDIAQDYVEALQDGNGEDINEAYRALVQSIAEQMPKTWREQADVIRYTAMLGAPLTHIRNTGGNAGFAPVVMVKNAIGAAVESFAVNVLGKDIERTKAFINPAATAKVIGSAVGDWGGGIRQNRTGGEKGNTERVVTLSRDSDGDVALVATAWMDYAEVAGDIMSGGKYSEDAVKDTLARDIQDARKTWKDENAAGRAANAVTEGVSTALEVEDQWFAQPAYAQALAGWLKANKITAAQYMSGEITQEQKAAARKYAIKEAQKATYRDTNAFSQAISKLRVRRATPDASLAEKAVRGAGRVFVEGQNPFFKTPANILVRAVEYSPLGLLGELSAGSVQLAKGNITAAEYIDGFAEGLTGTGLWLLGIWLAKLGVLTGGGSGDDKQDEFDKLQGKQDYAVCAGGKYYTLSWLAPEALPVFMGVEFVNRSRDSVSMWDATETAVNLSEPMLEMSMLSGIQDSLDAITYSEHKLPAYMANSCLNYFTQYVPSLFGQIERVTENTRQSTFTDKTTETPASIQRFAGKTMNKLPGEYNQIDFIDAWGRTQSTGNAAQRAVNNFLNPAYVSDKRTTEVETELQRLYDAGHGDVLPSGTSYSTKVEGEYLTKEQYVKYATTKGQTSLALVEKLMNMSAYDKMSNAAKNDAIKDIYDYATDEAKRVVNPKAEVPSWHKEAKASGNPAKYIADRAAYDDAADGKTGLAGLVEAAENGASEDILLANMSDAAKDAYASAKAGGASIENFANAYNYYYNEAKGDDKQMQVINYCYSVGKSPAEREALFNALYPKYKGKPIDWS